MKITREGRVFFPYEPCREREDALLSLLGGALAPEVEKELMEHVEHCPGCSSYLRLQEGVDGAFRTCFRAVAPVAAAPASLEMPKKLKVKLSEVRRDKLARWLFELGRVILFQQQEAVDTIHPGGPLVPADLCFRRLAGICRSSLRDSYLEEAGLSADFVKDSLVFVDSLRRNPSGLLDVRNTKEALDRALSVLPDFVPAVKFLGNYNYYIKDFMSCLGVFNRGLNLVTEKEEKRAFYKHLCIASSLVKDLEKVFYYIDFAAGIRFGYELEFDRFIGYLFLGDNENASKCIKKMIKEFSFESEKKIDLFELTVIKKWFVRNEPFLFGRFSNDKETLYAIESVKRLDKGT